MSRMGHFEREAKLHLFSLLFLLLVPLIFTVLGVFVFGLVESARVDRCLDRGGSYDYEARKCDHQTNHPGEVDE